MIADNSTSTFIRIDLGALFGSVGGFMTYTPGGAPIISALAANGVTVLETYDLSVAAPISNPAVNSGAFRGIQRPSADIRFFQIGGSQISMHDITLGPAASSTVPEPAPAALVGGVLMVGVLLGRRAGRIHV